MAWSRYNKDVLPTDEEIDSTADTDIDSLFDSSDDDKTDIISDASTGSLSEINDDTDNDASLFNGEVRHPPEHYLARAANVNVQRLRQRRYSPKTQDRLD